MSDTPTQLLSQLGYAKRRGVTHGAVQKAIKSQRLKRSLVVGDDGKLRIDPAIADQEWQANSDPAMQRKKPANLIEARAARPPGAIFFQNPAHLATALAANEGVPLSESRAVKEHYLALLAELDYKVKAGQLIEAAPARKAAFEASRAARDSLMTIADRLAPIVAGLSDQFACHQAISAEVRKALEELASQPLGAAHGESSDVR